MIKTLFLTLFILCFSTLNTFASIVIDGDDKYIVKSVRAEGASFENEQSTKNIAISQAKHKAFEDLLNHIKYENEIQINEVNIDAMISAYTIVDEYYNENFYSLIANFTFDKSLLKSFVKKNRPTNNKIGNLANYIVKLKEQTDIISEYATLKKYLQEEKIKYFPREITTTTISVLLENVDEDKIYDKLKELNINGSIYLD